jgi:hypothetical protein
MTLESLPANLNVYWQDFKLLTRINVSLICQTLRFRRLRLIRLIPIRPPY